MKRLYIPALLVLLMAGPALAGSHKGEMDHSSMDHSQHEMMGHSTERDEKGRRLHGMKHNITPEIANELREKVPLFEKYSDAELAMSMEMMGSNYAWYLSEDSMRGEDGVLLLLHGFKNADENFKQQVESVSGIFPMAMAPGMSMMMSDHIQLALNDLEAAGAKTIIVIPIVSTQYNTMLRQWEYIFGMQDEAPYATVPRIKTNAEILFSHPPGDDPLIAEIMLDHAYEISSDPANEVVIIAAHGPTFEDDNQKAMAQLDTLAKYMREDGDFADVMGLTLQDDAPKPIRDKNVAKLRAMVEAAQADGKDALVVTNLIGTRTIQAKLRKDLQGLDYTFNAKGIVAHPTFMKWMGETIREELDRKRMADVR